MAVLESGRLISRAADGFLRPPTAAQPRKFRSIEGPTWCETSRIRVIADELLTALKLYQAGCRIHSSEVIHSWLYDTTGRVGLTLTDAAMIRKRVADRAQ
ncbi:unnamed protein product, partial [Iphiclides podalirius]